MILGGCILGSSSNSRKNRDGWHEKIANKIKYVLWLNDGDPMSAKDIAKDISISSKKFVPTSREIAWHANQCTDIVKHPRVGTIPIRYSLVVD